MLEMLMLGFVVPIIIVCFLFCKYNFFKIYVVGVHYRFIINLIFYVFLATFYFVVGSFTFLYFKIVCFQYTIAITSFYLDGRKRGYFAFGITPVIVMLVQHFNNAWSIDMIIKVVLMMFGAILFCEGMEYLKDLNFSFKYSISLLVINVATPLQQQMTANNELSRIHLPIIFGTFIITSSVYLYSSILRKKEIHILELKHEANYDGLTDLLNYNSFSTNLDKSKGQKVGSVTVMFDIDNFKKINDTYGHIEGNEVIKFFSANLKLFFNKHCRNQVEIYRFGGEEFCLLFDDISLEKCFELVLEFQEKAATKVFYTEDGRKIMLTFSGGISKTKQDESISEVLREADLALYIAKKSGGSQIVCPDCAL